MYMCKMHFILYHTCDKVWYELFMGIIKPSAASVTGMDLNKMTLKMIFSMKPGQLSVTGYVCVNDKAHV